MAFFTGLSFTEASARQQTTSNARIVGGVAQIQDNAGAWQNIGVATNSLPYTEEITNAKLLGGASYVVTHGLSSRFIDVAIADTSGVVGIDWEAIDDNSIRLDFSGLIPIQIHTIRVETT